MSKIKIEMFFDHTCPFCYRGHNYLMGLLPKYPDVQILWRPIEAHPKIEEPEHKPYEDLAVQGALFVRDMGGDELAYHERVYRAIFEEHLKADDISVLTRCAGEIGAETAAFEAALRSAKYEKVQREANDYAYEINKVWCVPSFVCGDKRLDAIGGVGVTPEQLDSFWQIAAVHKKRVEKK
jgi:predicted DsbA family dithiol-disulfide isomerase